MASLRDIVDVGGLPSPQVPIKPFWHRTRSKWSSPGTRRQPNIDVLELPDTTVPDKFTGHPEAAVTPLLAAGLENSLGVAHLFYEALSFID